MDATPAFIDPVVNTFELHIWGGPDFTRLAWARKVKDLGGSYSECRGYNDTRFVFLPNTAPGRKLAAEIGTQFPRRGKLTLIFRDVEGTWRRGEGSSNLTVQEIAAEGREPAAVLDSIAGCLRRFEARAQAWWERKGFAAAVARVNEEKEAERWRKARALADAAASARLAFARGHSTSDVMRAVETALFRAASHAQLSRGAT
jgi:hypothetical protein